MGHIDESSIQEVTNRSDAIAIIGEYVRLEKKSGRYWGCCPFHNEKTPSFTVDPDKKFFYCFGCGKGGGLVNFIMEMDGLNFPEAIEHLAKKAGVELQYSNSPYSQKPEKNTESKNDLFDLYNRVAGSFNYILTKTEQGKETREYLLSRCLSSEIINEFKLGYAPADKSWLYNFLHNHGYSDDFLDNCGLFSAKHKKFPFFFDRLIFPIQNKDGKTIAFGGRILHGEGPKYINSSDSELFHKKQNLFALDKAIPDIRKASNVYICEGYMDVISLYQIGIRNAVAPLGTSFTEDQIKLLKRWCDRISLVLDSDEAGQNATVKAIIAARRFGLECEVIRLEDGKDPSDILSAHGAEALQKNLKYSINDFDYLLWRAQSSFDLSKMDGKVKAVAFLFPYLEVLATDTAKDACTSKISDIVGVDKSAVTRDFLKSNTAKFVEKEQLSVAHSAIRMNDELFILLIVSINRNLFKKFRAELAMEEFSSPEAKELYIVLEECFREGLEDIDSLVSKIQADNLKAFILEKIASKEFNMNPDKLLSDGITRIRQKRLGQRRSSLLQKMRIVNGDTSSEKETELILNEIMHIDAELARYKDVHS